VNKASAASAFILDQDLAGAMASAALAAGPERTVASAVRVVPAGTLTGALGHLRRAGLDSAVNIGLRGRKELLDQVRTKTAQAAGISVPQLAEPRRLSWSQVLVAVGTLIGGWALILTLINAAHSIDTITSAAWGWVVATALLCAASYLGTAYADLGSVPGSVAYGRTVGLEVASTFSTLAGGSAAVIATDVRFLQQQGYDTPVAVTSGALISAASFIVKGGLFLIAIPLAWGSFHFGNSLHQGGQSKILWLILAVVCAVRTDGTSRASRTSPTNRNPLRGMVRMRRWASPRSPIAWRTAVSLLLSVDSETIRPSHIVSIRSSLLTTRSRWAMRYCRMSNTCGSTATSFAPRRNSRRAVSSE